jgi:ABC-2 type transport system ATP-binding protein
MDELVIEAAGLAKRYGETRALAGVDLSVPAGTVLGVLGPNGAGKTTAVRILTTLVRPDEGWARVAGFDVATQAGEIRRRIGVTAQDATLDEALTGRQNLRMIAELSGLRRVAGGARATELLERFELTDAADRVLRGYSGGMRRRLDLAASLVARPAVLFLDEPTTGLDPTSRQRMWEVIRELVAQGTTLLLTTQYLDEADALADRIIVIDHGRVIAGGTASELKAATGGARLEVTLSAAHDGAQRALAPLADGGSVDVSRDGRRLRAGVTSGSGVATTVIRALDAIGALVDDVVVHPPSLDDVFFSLTSGADTPVGSAAVAAPRTPADPASSTGPTNPGGAAVRAAAEDCDQMQGAS